MFCSHCGKEIDDKAVICVNCGVPVLGAYGNGLNKAQPEQTTEKTGNPCAITGFVLAIAGVVLGIFFWSFILMSSLSFWLSSVICLLFIAALIVSIVGIVKSKKCNSGKGLAIAGTVISAIMLAIYLFYLFMLFFIFFLLLVAFA